MAQPAPSTSLAVVPAAAVQAVVASRDQGQGAVVAFHADLQGHSIVTAFTEQLARSNATYTKQEDRLLKVTDLAIERVERMYQNAEDRLIKAENPRDVVLYLIDLKNTALEIQQASIKALEPFFQTFNGLNEEQRARTIKSIHDMIDAQEKVVVTMLKMKEAAWKAELIKQADLIVLQEKQDKRDIDRLKLDNQEKERSSKANEENRHFAASNDIKESHERTANELKETRDRNVNATEDEANKLKNDKERLEVEHKKTMNEKDADAKDIANDTAKIDNMHKRNMHYIEQGKTVAEAVAGTIKTVLTFGLI